LTRPGWAFALWHPEAGHAAAHAAVREALDGFDLRESAPAPTAPPVLRLRTHVR
jgi:hypothetical protein